MERDVVLSGTSDVRAGRSISVRGLAASAGLVLLFTGLTALAGQVRVPLPFTPVPLTLQLIPVLLAGAALGSVRGAASQIALLVAGIAGVPVFSGGAFGGAHLLGATGGYIFGFVGAAWLVGRLLHGPTRLGFPGILASMLAGAALIHLFGIVHLGIFLGGSPMLAFELGSLPFIIADAIKAVLAASIVAAWPRRIAAGNDAPG
jgi:biotin transport system substrate-specific component